MSSIKSIRIQCTFIKNRDIRRLIAENKKAICQAVADKFEVDIEKVYLVSQIIEKEMLNICYNHPSLEIKIEVTK